MIIVKRLDGNGAWEVYHTYEGPTRDYILNTNAAYTTRPDRWADTVPTSSVFSIGNSSSVNGNGSIYIAYCFADVPGSSKIDYYDGSGSSGNEIEVGFKPAFLLIKSRAADNWTIIDDKRPGKRLYANENVADTDLDIELTNTGFKINSSLSSVNGSGKKYIYAAFADNDNPTVIDVDVANNTMVVDGGKWAGSDGSGSGDVVQDFIGNFVIRGGGTARPEYPVENAFDGNDATVCSTTAPFEIHFDPPMHLGQG